MNKVTIDCMCHDLPFTRTTTNDISKCHFTSFTHQVLEILLVWADKAKKREPWTKGREDLILEKRCVVPVTFCPTRKEKERRKDPGEHPFRKKKEE